MPGTGVYNDASVVRVGRAVALIEFTDEFSPFDDQLRASLTRKVVHRLQAALKASQPG